MDEKPNLHSLLNQYLFLSADTFICEGLSLVKKSLLLEEDFNTDRAFVPTAVVTSCQA